MKTYRPHPAALVMPLMKPADLKELKESILERGQVHPAIVLDGQLLDGRNRQEAIRQLVTERRLPPATELWVVDWSGNGKSPAGYVDATNDKRRHLTESQRAMIATRLLPFFRKEAKERQREAIKKANRQRREPGRIPFRAPGPGSAARAAKLAGGKVSERTVKRAEFVRKADPELARKVFDGEMTVKQAERKIRLRGQVQAARAYVPPEGKFAVIVADPPWEYDDELNGSLNRALPYPTMKLEEICAMKVPAAPDCALFLWTTKSHLLDGSAARVISAWGFTAKSMITWVKSNIGLGRYVRNRCEFVIIATRGSIPFDLEGNTSLKDDVMLQTGPRLSHSEKPDELFQRVEALIPSTSRLELFARQPRAGWVTSGSELASSPAIDDSSAAHPAPVHEEAPTPSAAPSFSRPCGVGTPSAEEIPF